MDIVSAYFPETKPKGALRLRPCLVIRVYHNPEDGLFMCELAFGTKNLKTWSRIGQDVIIQNNNDLNECGLAVATRFDMDPANRVPLPWNNLFFGCWTGNATPRIGSLPTDYQKDVAFILMKQIAG